MKMLAFNIFAKPLTNKVNPIWLVFLRCGTSAVAVASFLAIQADFDSIFSTNAFVPPNISDILKNPLVPSIFCIYKTINGCTGITYETVLVTARVVYPVCLLLLFAGLFTRMSAILSLVLQLVIHNSMDFYTYGVDVFITIGLFYCVVFPVGDILSLDARIHKNKRVSNHYSRYLWIFRAHICIVYFFSGFEKLLGYNWRNGESIWKMVHAYNNLSFLDLDFLYKTPIFFIAGWATIMVEILYPIFINIAKTRRMWLYAIIVFHVMIAFFMGLYFFSCVMIVLNLTAYYAPFIGEENA
jgi:Vitamin K-dependent gamma-carboxylase